MKGSLEVLKRTTRAQDIVCQSYLRSIPRGYLANNIPTTQKGLSER